MAVAYNDATSTVGSGAGAVTSSHTAAGTNRAAIVIAFFDVYPSANPSDITITYAGNSPDGTLWSLTPDGGWGFTGQLFKAVYFKEANVPTGAQTVSATMVGSGTINAKSIIVVSLTGVDQTTSVGTAATSKNTTGTAISSTVGSPVTDGLIVDATSSWQENTSATIGAGPDQTQRVTADPDTYYIRASTQPSSAGGAMTWTRNQSNYEYYHGAVEFKPASSGVTATASVTLGGLTVAGAGQQRIDGAGAVSLTAVSIAGQATQGLEHTGAGTIDLAAADLAGQGTQAIPGADGVAALTLPAPAMSAQGVQTIPGAGALGLVPAAVQASGIMQPAGAGAMGLGQFAIAASGLLVVPGASMSGLGLISIAASASHTEETTSTASVTLAGALLAAAAQLQISGAGAILLQPAALAAVAAHFVGMNGVGGVALSPAVVSGAASLAIPGAVAIALNSATIAANGLVIAPVAGSATIDIGVVSMAGNAALSVQSAAALNFLAAQITASGLLRNVSTGVIGLSAAGIAAVGTHTPPAATGAIVLPGIVIASAGATDIVVLPSELLGVVALNPAIYAYAGISAAIGATPGTEPAVAGELDL